MNVSCACGSGQAGERFIDRQHITAKGEDANSCCWTSSRGDLIGSQQDGAVDGIGVGGDNQGESKGEGPGEDDTFEHSSPSALGRESVGWNEYGAVARITEQLDQGFLCR